MEENPKQLMNLAKQGNKEAFGKLYGIYYTPVYRYAFLRLKNKGIAEDIAQTVFLKMYKKVSEFEQQKDSPLPFLFTIARNSIIDWFRKENRSSAEDDETLSRKIDERANHNFTEEKESKNLAELAMNILDGEQKEAVMLKFITEMPNWEIAKVLGKTEEAVRQIQSRGIKKIREHFKAKGIFE